MSASQLLGQLGLGELGLGELGLGELGLGCLLGHRPQWNRLKRKVLCGYHGSITSPYGCPV